MTHTEFVSHVNNKINTAQRSGFPSSLARYQAIADYITQLESIRDSAVAPYEEIVLPPFPAI